MFRRQLSWILLCLAVTIALQGAAAVMALLQAERKVMDGRIASDLHQSFVTLSATKQRLRAWTTQYLMGAGGDPTERDALHQRMVRTLTELSALAEESASRQRSAGVAPEHVARRDAIEVLNDSVQALGATLQSLSAQPADARATEAWDTLDEWFEQSKGRDLRQLISESIERERMAMERERQAADESLRFMRTLWLGISLLLLGFALAAALYVHRALRQPIDALVVGAEALRQGQLQHRIPMEGTHEFAVVAQSMNAMAQDLQHHRQQETQLRQLLEAQVRARTDALRQANESLQRTDERRRQLLADISHELRTPTTAIRGEAEVTLRGKDRPAAEYREALQRIVEVSRQLATAIDDLLLMARSDMDGLTVVRQPVDLHESLQYALVGVSALAESHAVTLGDNPLVPGQCMVLGDGVRLTQLVTLLLDNAVRYSKPGGRVWLSGCEEDSEGGPFLALQVHDQGIGIPASELPHVFERHFRGALARGHRASGSGLGLGIAWRLAQAHGAQLHIASPTDPINPGGTCVTLRLPLISPTQAEAWSLDDPPRSPGSPASSRS
jgi:signal transduction histidine kinase